MMNNHRYLTLLYISCMNVSFALIGSSISSGGTFSLVSFVSAEPQSSDAVCISIAKAIG